MPATVMQKGFFKNFIPDYTFNSVTDINPDFFKGSDLVILDLDRTLIFWWTHTTMPEIVQWVHEVEKRCHCIIFSNSFSFAKRASRLAKVFSCEAFLSKSKKPFKSLFRQMQQKYQFDSTKVFVTGDMRITDIFFGNRNNAKTILVRPLQKKNNTVAI